MAPPATDPTPDRPVRDQTWTGVARTAPTTPSSTRVTCVVHYVIDPAKLDAFEEFARAWMRLVTLHGGTHHGYFLPAEGANDAAEALFTFPSLAAYEQYRQRFATDPDFMAADQIRDQSGCVIRYDRTFMRPLLPEPASHAQTHPHHTAHQPPRHTEEEPHP